MFTLIFYDDETKEIFSVHSVENPIIEKEGEIKFEEGVFERVSAPYVLLVGEIEKERGGDVSDVLDLDVSEWFKIKEATKADILEVRLNELIQRIEGSTT